jgi:hypothetical protein
VVWLDLTPRWRQPGQSLQGIGVQDGLQGLPPALTGRLLRSDPCWQMEMCWNGCGLWIPIRRPLYRECADIVIQVEGKTPAAIVEELYAAMD